jgi:hypothetical protein
MAFGGRPRDQAAAMPTIGWLSLMLPVEPEKVASP